MDGHVREMIKEALASDLTREEIKTLLSLPIKAEKQKFDLNRRTIFVLVMLFGLGASLFLSTETGEDFLYTAGNSYCIFDHTLPSLEMGRPLANCSFCKDLSEVPKVGNVSKDAFTKNFAYSGIPLVVTNATSDWTAFDVFDFKFLKRIYNMSRKKADSSFNEGCQFFPYLTNFKTLKDVFEMSEKRASLREDQWYVGWSNCDLDVMNVIRKHYQRPNFIPDDSESSQLDWIFVGGHGKGAQMHIDFVDRPSWQAQISGMKTWTLVPTPECEHVCHQLSVTIKKGDIFAIDTNQWYHSTYIHPGEMSITIGSEYD